MTTWTWNILTSDTPRKTYLSHQLSTISIVSLTNLKVLYADYAGRHTFSTHNRTTITATTKSSDSNQSIAHLNMKASTPLRPIVMNWRDPSSSRKSITPSSQSSFKMLNASLSASHSLYKQNRQNH